MSSCKYIILLCLSLFIFFTSCEKDEIAVTLPPRGNTTFMTIDHLGKDFDKQGFFNLKDSSITLVNMNSWDLAFDASPLGINITINGGMDMYVARINTKKFIKTNKPDTLNYKWDSPCGCYDSLGINRWTDMQDKIYVLDRGAGNPPNRYYQIRFLSVNSFEYTFEYATLDNPDQKYKVTRTKDPSKVNVYFSFATPTIDLNFEPRRDKWDFCFLKYRYVFYENNPIVKYVVRGIFINSEKVCVGIDSTQKFELISPNYAATKVLYSNFRDVIGYDWKTYNFTSGQYVARTNVSYIVKDFYSGCSYKLRFLDFNNNGVKGTPKFEYVLLK